MIIRLALPSDLPAIRDIYNQGVRSRLATADEEEKSLEERTRWFGQFNPQHPLFVIEDNSQVMGYGAIFPLSPRSGFRFAVEHSVYIGESFQGQGLGRQLLQHLVMEACRLGYTYLEARIFKHNKVSLKLHESLGFKLLGIQVRVANLDGHWFDNCIYSLQLQNP